MSKKDAIITKLITDIKPTSDIFIAVFLSAPKNEPLLCALINAVLKDNSGRRLIKKATVLNPFSITEYAVNKRIILDVRVLDEIGRAFNIEIQTYPHPAFRDRVLFGWADSYSSQIPAGGDYTQLQPVMTIVITEFAFCPKTKRIHLVFEPRDRDNHELLLSEHLQIHVLQLHEVIKGHFNVLNEVVPELAYWSQFLALGGMKNEVEMAALTDNDPRIIEAHREFRHFTSDPKQRELERQRRLFLLDYHMGMASSKKEGIAEGEVKGKAKGKIEDALAVLRKRFTRVPKKIELAIRRMKDPVALESLVIDAATCKTLNEFAKALS